MKEKDRSHWRQQALAWLLADLDLRRKQLNSGDAKTTRGVLGALRDWQNHPDLAGVRDDKALDGLPEAERQDWRKLWEEVARVLEPLRVGTANPQAGTTALPDGSNAAGILIAKSRVLSRLRQEPRDLSLDRGFF